MTMTAPSAQEEQQFREAAEQPGTAGQPGTADRTGTTERPGKAVRAPRINHTEGPAIPEEPPFPEGVIQLGVCSGSSGSSGFSGLSGLSGSSGAAGRPRATETPGALPADAPGSTAQFIPDYLGAQEEPASVLTLCPAWWSAPRRARIAADLGVPELMGLAEALTLIEEPLRPVSLVVHIASQWTAITSLVPDIADPETVLIPIPPENPSSEADGSEQDRREPGGSQTEGPHGGGSPDGSLPVDGPHAGGSLTGGIPTGGPQTGGSLTGGTPAGDPYGEGTEAESSGAVNPRVSSPNQVPGAASSPGLTGPSSAPETAGPPPTSPVPPTSPTPPTTPAPPTLPTTPALPTPPTSPAPPTPSAPWLEHLVSHIEAAISTAVTDGILPSARLRDITGSQGVEVLLVPATTSSRCQSLTDAAVTALHARSIPAAPLAWREIEVAARIAGLLDPNALMPPLGDEEAEELPIPLPAAREPQYPQRGAAPDPATPTRLQRVIEWTGRHKVLAATSMSMVAMIATGAILLGVGAGDRGVGKEEKGQNGTPANLMADSKNADGNGSAGSASGSGNGSGEDAAGAGGAAESAATAGASVDNGVVRASLAPGWGKGGDSTAERLVILADGDDEVRVLVSAHPIRDGVTDDDLRRQVESMVNSRENFANYSGESAWRAGAVSYEESPSGGSTVLWTTFLENNQQVSVGCQWKGELTGARAAGCSEAARTAGVL